MLDAGCRTERFENTSESAWKVIGDVEVSRTTLQLQDEMVRGGKRLDETNAFAALEEGLSTWLKDLKSAVLRRLRH